MLTTTDKLDHLLLSRAALKGVIQDLEGALGITDAWPITKPVAKAICACDREITRVDAADRDRKRGAA